MQLTRSHFLKISAVTVAGRLTMHHVLPGQFLTLWQNPWHPHPHAAELEDH